MPLRARTAVVGVALGLGIAAACWAALRRADPGAPGLADLVELAGAERIDADGPGWWAANGFVALEPPIALPRPVNERTRSTVWLRLPPGGVIQTSWLKEQSRHTLTFPPGTVADRVALWSPKAGGPRVADVRGARVVPGGQRYRLMRPRMAGDGQPAQGYEWPAGDREMTLSAHAPIVKRMHAGGGFAWETAGEHRKKAIAKFEARNTCAGCHPTNRAAMIQRAKGLKRATDGHGFYVPLTLLSNRAPLETYRARDMNVDDPCVVVTCGDAPIEPVEKPGGARFYRCANDQIPHGTRDMSCTKQRQPERYRAICTGRTAIYQRLDAAGQAAFASAFNQCDPQP